MTSPRTVLGVPFLPPARVTAAANRLRTAVGRLERRMTPPPVQILDGVFGMLDHRALTALCEAGVPDALTGKTSVEDLAARLDADAELLGRLLRFAATRGWVRVDRRGRVRPTPVLAFLRRDHPGGWRSWVDFAGGDEVVAAVSRLGVGRDSSTAFAAANGTGFFDWLTAHPERSSVFDGAMAAGARMHGLTLDAAFHWEGPVKVCDVGGGTGELLRVLLDRHPQLTGTVLDLPGVVAGAVSHERLSAVAGDAFASVPAGFDVYLLVNVLHDWSDADAARILTTIRRSLDDSGRVIVVESDAAAWRQNSVVVSADLLMAALTEGGRERTTDEFSALGRSAGLRLARTVPLVSGDVAHEFVRGASDG